MAEHDDKADSTLPQTQTTHIEQTELIQQLSQLEDRLHNLLACYQFFGEAVRLMTDPEQTTCPEDWHLGLFLNQQWLREQGDGLMQELINTKQQLNH